MPFSNNFSELKKPENYGNEDTLFQTKGGPLYPSEVHANMLNIVKECGRLYTLTAAKTFTQAELATKAFIAVSGSTSFQIDVSVGLGTSNIGWELTVINNGAAAHTIKLSGTVTLSLKLGVSKFVWSGTAWVQPSYNGSKFRIYEIAETDFPINSVKIGLPVSTTALDLTNVGLGYNGTAGSEALYGNFTSLKSGSVTVTGLLTSGSITVGAVELGLTAGKVKATTIESTSTITATSFNVSSKREFKENIEKYNENALDLINSIDVVTYNYKNDVEKNRRVGFIADDTDKLVSGKEQNTMDVTNTLGVLIKAVQELSKKVGK